MIVAATAADVAEIVALERTALGSDAWSEALISDGIAHELPTVRYLVARDELRVIGYAVVSIVADVAELQRIAVDPAHRRARIGTALLEAVVAGALAAGAERLLLEVREDNAAALGFYAAAGFAEIDRRPRYYSDGTTAVVLARALTGPDVNEWVTE